MVTDNIGNIRPIKLEDEMRSSYLDYAMSVIVSRALPDVRDGLKPVHRRILYAMEDLNLSPASAYKKCARIVGEVLGKYHPHGDSSVYDALVRMAQDFSMRYPLVDGQGNFGSVDNDPPAAMRYTEARLSRFATEMLVDIDQDTVDFTANFDNSLREPMVLPARLPNLLVNGTSGIAVGMATNIPPHNLSEVCDGITHLIDHPDAEIDDLMALIKGPDFPTAGFIMGRAGIREAYHTGRGKVVMQARAEIVEATKGGRAHILITELPYQVNKAGLIEKIADLIKDKRIDGIAELRDESDRQGLRVVIELKRDTTGEQVLNNLYNLTPLRTAFHVNMLALVDGQPRVLDLRHVLQEYVKFRQEVVTRRSRFQLQKAQERDHILLGLITALDHLDAVIKTIRESDDAEMARGNLMTRFKLTQAQAQAILDMQLRRLAALERKKITDEHDELVKRIAFLTDLLGSPRKILGVVRSETAALKKEFGDERASEISDQEAKAFDAEDLIPHLNVVVTISNRGYAKRLPIETYRIQRRGGQGKLGMITREQDVVEHLLIVDTHDHLLFFTNKGRVLHTKAYRIPQEITRQAKGTPLVNLIPVEAEEKVTAVVAARDFNADGFLFMATKNGRVKRTAISEFAYAITRTKGIIAIKLLAGDELVSVSFVGKEDYVIGVTERGQALKFAVSEVRAQLRNAGGVRGMRIQKGDHLLDMSRVREGAYLLAIGEQGVGKLTKLEHYMAHHRGTGGATTLTITGRTGKVAASRVVDTEEELMIISKGGIMLRTTLEQVRITGRAAQGVRIMELEAGDKVSSIASFNADEPPVGPPSGGPAKPEAAAPVVAEATVAEEAETMAEEIAEEEKPEQEAPKTAKKGAKATVKAKGAKPAKAAKGVKAKAKGKKPAAAKPGKGAPKRPGAKAAGTGRAVAKAAAKPPKAKGATTPTAKQAPPKKATAGAALGKTVATPKQLALKLEVPGKKAAAKATAKLTPANQTTGKAKATAKGQEKSKGKVVPKGGAGKGPAAKKR